MLVVSFLIGMVVGMVALIMLEIVIEDMPKTRK